MACVWFENWDCLLSGFSVGNALCPGLRLGMYDGLDKQVCACVCECKMFEV